VLKAGLPGGNQRELGHGKQAVEHYEHAYNDYVKNAEEHFLVSANQKGGIEPRHF